jgi:subtilisin family serine protease
MLKLALLCIALAGVTFGSPALPTVSKVKVSSALEQILQTKGTADIFVSLEPTRAFLSGFKSANSATRADRKVAVATGLKAFAAESQKSILEYLNKSAQNAHVQSFWITNQIYIKNADAALVAALAERSDVFEITKELKNKIPMPPRPQVVTLSKPQANEWGLEKINVQPIWDQGINGTGVRVGIMDSGVRHTHEALRDNYVGEYGWFAPISRSPAPVDSDGHGTHCTGTSVGRGGIGVAPGAKFMACQNIPGAQAEDLACAQFFACPHLPDGSNPDCSKAADVVSNSWGYTGGNAFFDGAFDAWEAAGIVPVFAAGNEGPGCTSLRSPGDSSHRALVTVGSTDINDNLSTFTSFGPSRLNNVIKPDVAAPGTNVRSSYNQNDNSYTTMSGTSMATPHVAGVVALIISANPNATIPEVQSRLYGTAAKTVPVSGRNCGGVSETIYPNNHVGHGRLSASAAAPVLKK